MKCLSSLSMLDNLGYRGHWCFSSSVEGCKIRQTKAKHFGKSIMGQSRLVSAVNKSRTFVYVGVISSILLVWKYKQRMAFFTVIKVGQSQLRVVRNTTRKSYSTFYRGNIATSLGYHLGTS